MASINGPGIAAAPGHYACPAVTDIQDPRATRNDSGGPSRPLHREEAAVLSLANWFDQALTWGLEPGEREEILQERKGDRYEHVTDPDASMVSVMTRSLRSSLGDVWYRFIGTETSALPLAIVFAVVGVAALADAFTGDIPQTHAILNAVTGIGYLALAAAGLRQPRKLQRVWLLPGLLLASVGTMAGAILMPVASDAGPFAWFSKVALAGVATGLAVVAVALVVPRLDRVWITRGGTIIWGSALFMAVGAAGWAFIDAPIYSTRWSSLMVAVACVLGAAVIARLRNIEVG